MWFCRNVLVKIALCGIVVRRYAVRKLHSYTKLNLRPAYLIFSFFNIKFEYKSIVNTQTVMHLNKFYAVFVIGLLAATGVWAQPSSFSLNDNPVPFNSSIEQLPSDPASGSLIIETSRPLRSSDWQHSKVTLLDHLGGNRYIVQGAGSYLQQLPVTGWAVYESRYKIAQDIYRYNTETDVMVYVSAGMTAAGLKALAGKYNGTMSAVQQWAGRHLYLVRIHPSQLEAFAGHPSVLNISLPVKDEVLLEHARNYVGAGKAILPQASGGRGLAGRNVVVGVGDDAHPLHIDISDRLHNFNPQNASTHGYHVATTVGGAGIVDPRYAGFAPKSVTVTNYFSNIITESENYLQDFGMSLTNNSYGAELNDCNAFGVYSVYSKAIDDQLNDNPTLLHVFAAGNSANRTCPPFPFNYRTVAGHYQTTKNVLTVANIGKAETFFSNSSSVGPVRDGRLKPEITAMGSLLIAGGNNNNYFANTGTSMACPNVAGAAALFTERYQQLHGTVPEGALLKVLLMNGATDIGNPGPDYKFGFGLMNLEHSLGMLENQQYFSDTVNTGTSRQFTINVPANTALLNVMLYWHDASGNPSSAKALVNDLDLRVTDPGNNSTDPWILNPAPANVADNATRGTDRLNNVEQVSIQDPVAGTYTIHVHGYDVSVPDQKFFVAYDVVERNLRMRFPLGGEKVVAGTSQYIYWESPFNTGNTTIEFSSDNGSTWSLITTLTNPATRNFQYTLPAGINSLQCRIRVTQNGYTIASNNFTVMQRPVVTLAPLAEQCPGNVKLNWTPTPNATAYRVYRKIGDEMVAIATTSTTTYTVYGLSQQETQWLGVAAMMGTQEGERSVAISRLPNNGGCTGFSNGDLALTGIAPGASGRKHTQRELSATTPLSVTVHNLSGNAVNAYNISYRVNNGAWVQGNYTTPVANTNIVNIPLGTIDMSNPGKYEITAVIRNLNSTDQVTGNDTFSVSVFHWANAPLTLDTDLVIDFEGHDFSLTGVSVLGIDSIEYLDFNSTTAFGESKSFVNRTVTLGGSRSVSMYTNRNVGNITGNASKNTITGTFNLSLHDTASSEIRLEFEYLLPGYPGIDSLNSVWIRDRESSDWVKLMDYFVDTVSYTKQHSGSISLTDIFKARQWNFTSGVQVKWEQYDLTLLSSNYYGKGVTLDNIKVYKVENDVFLAGTDSVFNYNCAMGATIPIRLKVGNGMSHTVYDIPVAYRIDNGTVISGLIDSIAGKDTVTYTFSVPATLDQYKVYALHAWVYLATDTYRTNDSMLNFNIRNQPVITAFPYLQTFEDNDGFFYTEGINSSWQYGRPSKSSIRYAASGHNVWVTDTVNTYANNQLSFLYSPCFDVSSLTNPHLSLSLIYDLENADKENNTIFDHLSLEYSNDGHNWYPLGTKGEGYNWYNNEHDVFTGNASPYWQVATIAVPNTGAVFSFRARFVADRSTAYGGVAIDDIHIYDLVRPVYTGDSLRTALVLPVPSNTITTFAADGGIIANITSGNTALGNVSVQSYGHDNFINPDSSQYFLPRNYLVQPVIKSSDTFGLQLFIEDEAVKKVRADIFCGSCSRVNDVYRMGASIYGSADKNRENNRLSDNLPPEDYVYLPYTALQWVPYDKGYYAVLRTARSGEIWFNDGGPTRDKSLGDKIIELYGTPKELVYADLQWHSYIDAAVQRYHLQRKNHEGDFETIYTTAGAGQASLRTFPYLDIPPHDGQAKTYRVAFTLTADSTEMYYSNESVIDWAAFKDRTRVYPNPVTDGKIHIEWHKNDGEPVRWALINSAGQVIMYDDFKTNAFGDAYVLDLHSYGVPAGGIYILRLYSNKRNWDYKLSVWSEQ